MDISGNNVPKYDKDQQLYLGGGGLVSTSKAYANYLRIWLNNGRYGKYQFLNPSTITDMMTSIRKGVEATLVPLEVHFAITVSLVNGVPKASMLSDLPKCSSTTRVEC